MPLLLAIETSQRHGGVALRDLGGSIHVEMLSQKKRHDDDLLPAIDRLFVRCQLKPADLRGGAVGVSVGPGGFTGLRIAVATAKMFAEALGAKVIAVPSAMVVAESVKNETEVLIALASKADSFWATRLTRIEQTWSIAGSPGLATAQSLNLDGAELLLGDEHLPQAVRSLCAARGVSVAEPVFDPRACLVAAERMLERGETIDPLTLAPLYPREPEAVTLWNQKAATKGTG